MAKQVGLFGLRGKIENKSFYKTAGVQDTVIRQIPEGLSSRVKTADEYANTRLNNAEFKNGNKIASFLLNAVPDRRTSMMRRFATALMTKQALEYIKAGTGQWGARIPSATMDGIAVDLLENFAKGGAYQGEFGNLSFDVSDGEYTIEGNYDEATAASLIEKGVSGFYVLVVKGAMAEIVGDDGEVRQHFGVSSINVINKTTIESAGDDFAASFIPSYTTLGMSPMGYTAAQGAANNGMYAIITFVPYRQIGSQRHTLYEYATYAALALGAIPTE